MIEDKIFLSGKKKPNSYNYVVTTRQLWSLFTEDDFWLFSVIMFFFHEMRLNITALGGEFSSVFLKRGKFKI